MSGPEPKELLSRALVEIRTLKARVKELEGARHAPIAIVGYGCRFPGAPDPASFWTLLRDGVDAVREVPRDRFDVDLWYHPDPDEPGKIYARRAAFLDRVDGFDPGFFGISPREAANLSLQQRLLLEVAWEALEDANVVPAELFGSATGVFVGQCGFDEGPWNATGPRSAEEIDLYSLTGSTLSITAGRLSYFLGLTGPSLAVDTACSSSLVAVQLACQSLRARECDRALAAGVHVLT
jgi:acyl transferase domain-containing protein